MNRGDFETAHRLAGQVLQSDATNADAEDLLAADTTSKGELRRVTIMFCDLVGSTALSSRHDPEVYRRIVGRYKETCRHIVEDVYGGRITTITGDGLLILFGFPRPTRTTRTAPCSPGSTSRGDAALSARAEREVGEALAARVGVHRGSCTSTSRSRTSTDSPANVAARLHELAAPGSVVVSEAIVHLDGAAFRHRGERAPGW